jgi:hypothetical protein
MSTGNSIAARALARFAEFNPRERMLLGVLASVLVPGLFSVVVYLLWTQLATLEKGNSDRREVIEVLLVERESFEAAAARQARIEEQLESNSLRLSSFLEGRATELDVPQPSDFDDINTPATGGVQTLVTVAKFTRMDLGELATLLSDIENSEELVYIRGINVEPTRGANAQAGMMQVELTLATFRRAEAGGGDDE